MTTFWCIFSAYFFPWKCFLFNTLSIDQVSVSEPPSLSRYQTICVFYFLFRQLINSKIYLWSSCRAMTYRGNKGKREIQKFKILRRKSFLDEIKAFFKFCNCYHWWKKEELQTKALPVIYTSISIGMMLQWELNSMNPHYL